MDTENIIIFEKDMLNAQRICASITDDKKRNKAVANVLAAQISAEYFDSANYDIDTQSALHNIESVVEQFDISDIYVNDAYVDVRVYFSDEEMCVPKVHFDTGILPITYMFIKMSEDLKSAYVTGFIYPESVDKTRLNNDVYSISMNDLCTFYDVEVRLKKQLDTNSIDNVKIYELLEGSLNDDEIIEMFKTLVRSKHSRLKLIKAVKAQSAFNFVSTPAVKEQAVVEEVSSDISADDTEDIDISEEDLDSLFASEDEVNDLSEQQEQSFSTEVTPSGAEVIESLDNEAKEENAENTENSEQIETLFTGEQEGVPVSKKKKGSFFPILLLLLILGGGAYFWYTHNANKLAEDDYLTPQPAVEEVASEAQDDTAVQGNTEQKNEAMPVETVEDVKQNVNNEESTSAAIPAIERNLDASVLVSNLKIDWEVPEGYASNTAAKRYLVKLGKIIQLNLKTELLLLNKPPLSNKITVELKYNSSANKFEVVGLQMSSGEKTVDDTVLNTVRSALSNSAGTNMESFAKLQGNPVLIINL